MNKRKSKGFTLVEMAVALGAAGTMAVVSAQEGSFETSQDKARALGNEVYQYNAGVSRYLVANASDSSVVGTHSGSDWLKGSTCPGGLADKSYLSCDLIPSDKTLQYSSTPRTTITQDADGSLQARTVWDTVTGDEGKPDTMVMGIAALVASGNYVSQVGDAAAGYQSPTLFCPETAGASAAISDACDTDRNAIVSLASTNGSTDAWLRRDHGNTMSHVIEFDNGSGQPSTDAQLASVDGSNWRQMVNVSRIYNMGASGNDSLILGKMYGSALNATSFVSSYNLLQNSIVMDGNLGVMNDLYVRSNAVISGDVAIQGATSIDEDLSVKGNIETEKDIVADGDIEGMNIQSLADLSVGGELEVGDDATFNKNIYGRSLIDNDDNAYFVDPDKYSNFNKINTNGRLSTDEFIHLKKETVPGNACSPNGLVSRDKDGKILSCVKGKWTASAEGWKSYGDIMVNNGVRIGSDKKKWYTYSATEMARIAAGSCGYWMPKKNPSLSGMSKETWRGTVLAHDEVKGKALVRCFNFNDINYKGRKTLFASGMANKNCRWKDKSSGKYYKTTCFDRSYINPSHPQNNNNNYYTNAEPDGWTMESNY